MIKKILVVVLACVGNAPGPAYAETKWRMGLELIHDWSLFHCVVSMPDRIWYFTLKGSTLKAEGPEGAGFTTTVADNGRFRATFTGNYTKPGTDRTDYPSVEMTGNLKDNWIHLHDTTFDCWYKLVPR
jgi:hypothetical protein